MVYRAALPEARYIYQYITQPERKAKRKVPIGDELPDRGDDLQQQARR